MIEITIGLITGNQTIINFLEYIKNYKSSKIILIVSYQPLNKIIKYFLRDQLTHKNLIYIEGRRLKLFNLIFKILSKLKFLKFIISLKSVIATTPITFLITLKKINTLYKNVPFILIGEAMGIYQRGVTSLRKGHKENPKIIKFLNQNSDLNKKIENSPSFFCYKKNNEDNLCITNKSRHNKVFELCEKSANFIFDKNNIFIPNDPNNEYVIFSPAAYCESGRLNKTEFELLIDEVLEIFIKQEYSSLVYKNKKINFILKLHPGITKESEIIIEKAFKKLSIKNDNFNFFQTKLPKWISTEIVAVYYLNLGSNISLIASQTSLEYCRDILKIHSLDIENIKKRLFT
tara:strand:- start:11 stop:1048 length:1038 start_codon:yes stop_codon:yes gene_type:complete